MLVFEERLIKASGRDAIRGCVASIRDEMLARTPPALIQQQSRTRIPNLYDGIEGVELFLGYLGACLQDDESHKRVRQLARTVNEPQRRQQDPRCGVFVGSGSALYLCAHLASIFCDDEFLGATPQLLEAEYFSDFDKSPTDVISGVAGLILALDALNELRPDDDLLISLVDRAATNLCGRRVRQNGRLDWRFNTGTEEVSALGFAHGAAGCAAALETAGRITGNRSYLDLAAEAFTLEGQAFNPQFRNWPHSWSAASERVAFPFSGASWCWGAPGMALARLRCRTAAVVDASREDALRALNATAVYGFSLKVQCLCHGVMGSIDALRTAGVQLDDPYWHHLADINTGFIVNCLIERGLVCEITANGNDNRGGLMRGPAGVGYALLRTLFPQVPSILAVETPRSPHGSQ